MIKLIFKNLWARKGRNLWLLIELTLVTIVAWVVIDPVVVYTYAKFTDPGYDIDRLATVSLGSYAETSPFYDENEQTPEAITANVRRLIRMLETRPEVEVVTMTRIDGIECPGSYNSGIAPKDTMIPNGPMHMVHFLPESNYFKTYGIRDRATGLAMEDIPLTDHDAIVTVPIVDAAFPDENPIGKSIYAHSKYHDENERQNGIIRGVTENVVFRSMVIRTPIAFIPQKFVDDANGCRLVMRIREGMDVENALENMRHFLLKDLKAGNVYAHSPQPYSVMRSERASGENKMIIRCTAIALFFFINLCIGITATFYMQTRKRSRDAGILRSFGAKRSYIVRELLGEGWTLTVAAWLLGCITYCIYIKDEGLSSLNSWGNIEFFKAIMPLWIDDFWIHFGIISAVILAIMLAVVTIGIYIPARHIASIRPVDSLRSE